MLFLWLLGITLQPALPTLKVAAQGGDDETADPPRLAETASEALSQNNDQMTAVISGGALRGTARVGATERSKR